MPTWVRSITQVSRGCRARAHLVPCGALVSLTVLVSTSGGCRAPITQDADVQTAIRRVENRLAVTETVEDRMAHHSVPGMSVAVISDYEVAWAKGYGVLQAGSSVPVTADTRFQAASISKPVAAVGALHYVEQGLLDLDADVNSQLVSWQVPDNEFTEQADVTLR